MEVKIISDLHLEFGGPEFDPGHGDILILAGDIVCAKNIVKNYDYAKFFEKASKQFNRTLMVMGNHEHYGYNVSKTYGRIVQHLPDNIRLLEDEMEIIEDWMFIGSTLWTDCNKADPITLYHLNGNMNDFQICQIGETYRKFRSEDAVVVHRASRRYIDKCITDAAELNKKAFVITHHAPHENSVDEMYKHDPIMNGGYRSDLTEMMLDRPQLRYWVHGHMHNTSDYMIDSCRVIANPRGYWPRDLNKRFDPECKIVLE
jgi:predicted phosphohydrolase